MRRPARGGGCSPLPRSCTPASGAVPGAGAPRAASRSSTSCRGWSGCGHGTGGCRSISLVNRVAFTGDDGRPLADLYSSVIFLDRDGAFGDKRYMDVPPARYSTGELDAIGAQYDKETDQRRGPLPLYWEDVEVGVPLLSILKGPLTMTNLVGWKQGWGSSLCPTNRIAHQHLRENPGSRLYNAETGTAR